MGVADETGFDAARLKERIAEIEPKELEPIIRRAAESFYEHVLSAAEDYLRENLDWNISSHISMLERENQRMRTELFEVDKIIGPNWSNTGEMRNERARFLDKAYAQLLTLRSELALGDFKAAQRIAAQPLVEAQDA